jgi:uncharacterized protein Yka (UPF0111/DUF47 family)
VSTCANSGTGPEQIITLFEPAHLPDLEQMVEVRIGQCLEEIDALEDRVDLIGRG